MEVAIAFPLLWAPLPRKIRKGNRMSSGATALTKGLADVPWSHLILGISEGKHSVSPLAKKVRDLYEMVLILQ